jgi:3-deoxy-manno-octulosonate cytidylyltransferase (CMP-KDO synthetase)
MNGRSPTAVAIVPVRLGSRRLPGKALLDETDGRPLFLLTCDAARAASRFQAVYVATDDDQVAAAAEQAGVGVLRTSEKPRTGSERCAEAAADLDGVDIVVDIQGDWPEVAAADLDALVDCLADGAAPTATLAAPLQDGGEHAGADNPNVVKVVRGLDGDALYFSRAAIPFNRAGFDESQGQGPPRLRHIGVYAFTYGTLLAIPELPGSGLAETESLEQLRFLENGIRMRVLDATGSPWGIETREDYDAFVARWRAARATSDTTRDQQGGQR